METHKGSGRAPKSKPDFGGWLIITPPLIWLLLLSVAPLIVMIIYSFALRSDSGEVVPGIHAANFKIAFDRLYLEVFLRSILLAGITTIVCLIIAYPAAYWIARRVPETWKQWLVLIAVLPFWTSFLIRTYAWIGLLRTEGVINQVLIAGHLVEAPLNLLYSNFAVLLGLVYGELPFMILPLFVVLERIDERLLEAAQDLGADKWSTFVQVTLPLSRPGILAGILFVFIPSIGAFLTPDLLGGAKSIMIGNVIQNQFVQRNAPLGSALALILTAISLGMTWLVLRAGVRHDG